VKFPKPKPRAKREPKGLRRSPLRAREGLKSRTRVNPMSRQRRVESRVYGEKSRAYLQGMGRCERCGRSDRGLELHHKAGRTGERYLDVSTWAALCPECHAWVHANPRVATGEGWLIGDLSVRK